MSDPTSADEGVTLPPRPPLHTEGGPAAAPPPGRTVLPDDPQASSALPAGHRLHEFTLERLIGEGGFGIVYLARDNQLQRTVAIKEYMPAQLAYRLADQAVSVRSRRHAETFALGLRSFINEARLLASFDHPALVKVYRFWEGNGTAYMVMPYYEGPTLKAWLLDHDAPPDERWLKGLLRPLLDVLEIIHASHCYHRDIAPDNILLLAGKAGTATLLDPHAARGPAGTTQPGPGSSTLPGRPRTTGPAIPGDERQPLLLDFGAARRVIGDSTQTLTVFLKPGYAPIEQYAEAPSMKQGPWTDVYALCAVMYAAIMGYSPTPSVARMIKDELQPLAQAAAGRYSDSFLRAIDAGLAVNPADRPQDMASLRRLFFPEMFVPTEPADLDEVPTPRPAATGRGHAFADPEATVVRETARLQTWAQAQDPTVRPPAAAPVAAPALPPLTATVGPPVAAAGGTRRHGLAVGLGTAVLGAAGLAWWMAAPGELPAGPAQVAATDPQSSVGAAAPASAPPPQAGPAAAPREPFSIVAALEQIVRQADPLFAVNTLPDHSPIVVGRDRLQFRVKSSAPGYLYVYLAGTDASHFWLLFPNRVDASNRLEADRETVLPRAGWHITAGGPPGINHIVTVVTQHPMDLAPLGLRRNGDIQEFDLEQATRLWASHTGTDSPFLGPPRCPAAQPVCEQRYGAALVRIEEINPPGRRP